MRLQHLSARCRRNTCGDGFRNIQPGSTEECDDGNPWNNDACIACKNATCGDGQVLYPQHPLEENTAPGSLEECDDGNTVNTDACLNVCSIAKCGDNVIWAGQEQCDNNTPFCVACNNARCGDGVVLDVGGDNWYDELCDDGNTVDNDACSNSCVPNTCGDGAVQLPEQCDDGNTVDTDYCRNSCHFAQCGDKFRSFGIVNPLYTHLNEECDDGKNGMNDACRDDCRNAWCGDGYLQPGEECDLSYIPNGFTTFNPFCKSAQCDPASSCPAANTCKKVCDATTQSNATHHVAHPGTGQPDVCFLEFPLSANASPGDLTGTEYCNQWYFIAALFDYKGAPQFFLDPAIPLSAGENTALTTLLTQLGQGTANLGAIPSNYTGYTNWATNEPNNGENWVYLVAATGRWVDEPGATTRPYLCEFRWELWQN